MVPDGSSVAPVGRMGRHEFDLDDPSQHQRRQARRSVRRRRPPLGHRPGAGPRRLGAARPQRGVGVVLYVAGWLLLPADGRDTAPAEDMFGDTLRRWPREVWVAIVVIACVAGFALFSAITPFGIGPAVVVAADLVLRLLPEADRPPNGRSSLAAAGRRAAPAGGRRSATPVRRPPSPRRPRPGSGGSPSTRRPSGRPFPRSRRWTGPPPGTVRPAPGLRPADVPARSGRRPGPGRRPGAGTAGGLPRHPRSGGPLRRADGIQRSGAAGPSRAATVRPPTALGDAAGPGPDHERPRHRGHPGRRIPPPCTPPRRCWSSGSPWCWPPGWAGPADCCRWERCWPSCVLGLSAVTPARVEHPCADRSGLADHVRHPGPVPAGGDARDVGTLTVDLSRLTLATDTTYAARVDLGTHRGDRAPEHPTWSSTTAPTPAR